MSISFRSFGAAGEVTGSKHLVEVDGKRILVDCGAFQGRRAESNEKNRALLGDLPASSIDAVVLTHAHFDHCMDAPAIALRTGARVHGSANTCRLMQAAGLPAGQTHIIASGDDFKINGIRVSVLPAAHPWIPGYSFGRLRRELEFPLRLRDYRMDACFSFLLEFEGTRILVWSSTQPEGAPRADLLTCRAVSSQRWYDRLLQQVHPKLVLPQHWDDTYRPLSDAPQPFFSAPRPGVPPIRRIDLADFTARVRQAAPDCAILVPSILKVYSINLA